MDIKTFVSTALEQIKEGAKGKSPVGSINVTFELIVEAKGGQVNVVTTGNTEIASDSNDNKSINKITFIIPTYL
jgi:hypothetical protein